MYKLCEKWARGGESYMLNMNDKYILTENGTLVPVAVAYLEIITATVIALEYI